MSTRPRLTHSIPFWALVAFSLASGLGGAYLLFEKLGGMDARLTDGTATSNDVYVGQIWAILGAILIGAGVIGLTLALTVAALRSFVPAPAAEVVEPPAFDGDDSADEYGYDAQLGYEANEVEEASPANTDADREAAPAAR